MDYKKLRDELDCARPLFFFHDDPDGLCSFLLLYRYLKEGKGIIVKSHPTVDSKFLDKVAEYEPDKIFVLDLALIDDNFLEYVKTPIVWIDHHLPQESRGTRYYNSRLSKEPIPASLMCYNAVQQDLWIAMVGSAGDWFFPPQAAEFSSIYPELLPPHVKEPGTVLFDTELGKLARIFSFVLKGTTQDAMKCVKILTRIDGPNEILQQTSSRGKFVYKRYEKIGAEYTELLTEAAKKAADDIFLVFIYPGSRMSFTGDLSNELLYRFPGKIIIVGRDKSSTVKCSLRTGTNINILSIMEKALVGLKGTGGGHNQACAAVIDANDFEPFLKNMREQYTKSL